MKIFLRGLAGAIALSLVLSFFGPVSIVHAATSPSLGAAANFGILGYTYNNSSTFTSITGDLGYTIAPSVSPSVSGTTHVNDATYTQAVNDQKSALITLNSWACTTNFPAGTIDLGTANVGSGVGVFPPGVYCISGSMTVSGGATVTLSGAGTYIFRPTGTLITSDNSVVTGANGVSACDVFWTPGGDATIGASSNFAGTVIEPQTPVTMNITVGAHTNWGGRALNGDIGSAANVNTGVDVNINVLTCGTPATATLHVIKVFYNDYGGTAVPSNATVHVKNGAGDVAGSPQAGSATPGTSYTLNPDTYIVSEDAYPGYTAIFSGDCDSTGHVTLASGNNKTCTISNDQNPPVQTTGTLHVIKHVINNNGGVSVASSFNLHVKGATGGGMADVAGSPAAGVETPGTSYTLSTGTYVVSEDANTGYTSTFSGDCNSSGSVTLATNDNKTCTITNDDIAPISNPATLHIIKHVINNDGGISVASAFILHVKGSGSFGLSDVAGSPATGVEAPGTSYTLATGTYIVSEDVNSAYTSTFSGDCDANGSVTLAANDNKTCTITNDDIAGVKIPPSTAGSATLHVIKTVINDNGGKALVSDAVIHVTTSMGDVAGSPHSGVGAPGTGYTLIPGTYNVSENFFAGYQVTVTGDCAVNGDITLVNGDNKTCTITNNDIVVPPSVTIITPTPVVPVTCDICGRLTYDVYIINPNLTERHTGTSWVRVTDRGNKIKRYSFEDATIDPRNPLYDYNDSVIDVDFTDCKNVKFMFISSDASWKHQVKIKVMIDGVQQSDTLVAVDSKAVVGTIKTINASTGVNTQAACLRAPAALRGKILLQVQQHGEAWYVRPSSGLRYYMKDGDVAYGMMRNFGLGITDKDLAAIPSVQTIDELKKSVSFCSNSTASRVKGNILLQVQQHGEAWYVDTTKCRRIYMKDGAAAYSLMRFLGLGITDADLNKLPIGQ